MVTHSDRARMTVSISGIPELVVLGKLAGSTTQKNLRVKGSKAKAVVVAGNSPQSNKVTRTTVRRVPHSQALMPTKEKMLTSLRAMKRQY